MKSFFLFLIVFSTNCISQTYYPIFKTQNTCWKHYFKSFIPYKEGIDSIKNIGDSTFNSKTYKIINGYWTPKYVREDSSSKTIFEYNPTTNSEKILYDFSLNKGDLTTLKGFDSLCNSSDVIYEVDTTFSINIQAGMRKVIKLHSTSGYKIDLTWIESVGAVSLNSSLEFIYNLNCPGSIVIDVNGRGNLICKSDDNMIIYQMPLYIRKKNMTVMAYMILAI